MRQMANLELGYHHEDNTTLSLLHRNPNKMMGWARQKKRSVTVNTFKMLVDKEGNHSTRGCFSINDRGHGLSRYLHVNEP